MRWALDYLFGTARGKTNTSDAPASVQDILVDHSKEAQIRELGKALEELEMKGNWNSRSRSSSVTLILPRSKPDAPISLQHRSRTVS